MFVATRSKQNPLLVPHKSDAWQGLATFNPSPVRFRGKFLLIYRAISATISGQIPEQMSTIGCAEKQKNGTFATRQIIKPSQTWDQYGCEDPRVCKMGSEYYIFYTALGTFPFGPDGIKAAVAVTKDFKKFDKHLCTPFNAKALALFPEKIGGKFWAVLSVDTDRPPAKLVIVPFQKISDVWNHTVWNNLYPLINDFTLDLKRSTFDHIEVGAPPIETKYGWLVIYSHIQNYFGGGDKIFGIEAVLLDKDNPRKIVGRTRGPIVAPEKEYELHGVADNIVFPSGAEVVGRNLHIYYGGADTVSCKAVVDLDDLAQSIFSETKDDFRFARYFGNPILLPDRLHAWESQAVLNPAALDIHGTVRILYRAFSKNNTSTIGYAESKNGLDIDYRADMPIYVPREDFEVKKTNGNSGCEDPRLVEISNRIYMFYTAYNGRQLPDVAVTSIRKQDFLARNWQWSKPVLITPNTDNLDDKDTCIMPEKIKGKWMVLHRIGGQICADFFNTLDFEKEKVNKCITILEPRKDMWDSQKVGISAPPIKTKYGWLLLYHGISKNHNTYRVGAALLDLTDPTIVLARSTDPILEPQEPYELAGLVPNVVFPCGLVERKGTLFLYYGGADTVVGVATMKLKTVLDALTRNLE